MLNCSKISLFELELELELICFSTGIYLFHIRMNYQKPELDELVF